ncbi:MAG: hypothetical protein L0G99_17890, partial [Propionibacteriales bacterium]|nr:hypothetical protein [Propionibacteriales bacterium]
MPAEMLPSPDDQDLRVRATIDDLRVHCHQGGSVDVQEGLAITRRARELWSDATRVDYLHLLVEVAEARVGAPTSLPPAERAALIRAFLTSADSSVAYEQALALALGMYVVVMASPLEVREAVPEAWRSALRGAVRMTLRHSAGPDEPKGGPQETRRVTVIKICARVMDAVGDVRLARRVVKEKPIPADDFDAPAQYSTRLLDTIVDRLDSEPGLGMTGPAVSLRNLELPEKRTYGLLSVFEAQRTKHVAFMAKKAVHYFSGSMLLAAVALAIMTASILGDTKDLLTEVDLVLAQVGTDVNTIAAVVLGALGVHATMVLTVAVAGSAVRADARVVAIADVVGKVGLILLFGMAGATLAVFATLVSEEPLRPGMLLLVLLLLLSTVVGAVLSAVVDLLVPETGQDITVARKLTSVMAAQRRLDARASRVTVYVSTAMPAWMRLVACYVVLSVIPLLGTALSGDAGLWPGTLIMPVLGLTVTGAVLLTAWYATEVEVRTGNSTTLERSVLTGLIIVFVALLAVNGAL